MILLRDKIRAAVGLFSGARTGTTSFTAYISPYMVVGNGGQLSKHIYMGSQRIVSKLCNSGSMDDPTQIAKAGAKDFTTKYADLTGKVKTRYDSLGVTYRGTDNRAAFYTPASTTAKENQQYFYHSDHLGSSSLITDVDGNEAQHIEYIPFGEVFIDERNNTWNTPYKFNGKELDEETGLYYYGARYYDPRTSVWISVDPLAEKYPNTSPYVYCHNNPIKYIDPDGRSTNVVARKNGTYKVVGGNLKDGDKGIYVGTLDKKKNFTRTSVNPIGKTTSMTSFYNSDNGEGWMGTINPKDKSGQKFISKMMSETPNLMDYMAKAGNKGTYDFKATNGTDKEKYKLTEQFYRGMPTGQSSDGLTIYSSARDIGNIIAGWVAGSNGLGWDISRAGFDAYNLYKNHEYPEGASSQNAERIGWKLGFHLHTSLEKAYNLSKSIKEW